MAPYIYGARNSIHIIDLAQTVPLLHQALKTVSDTVAKGGRVLFVGTKRQAASEIAEAAKRSAQYFVNSRWLGGTLTNWKTISASISRLRKLDEHARRRRQGPDQERAPDAVARARKAREGARRHQGHGRRRPTSCSSSTPTRRRWRSRRPTGSRSRSSRSSTPTAIPTASRYPIPGNDDASRAIQLYCDLVARAAIDGISRSQGAAGVDIGEAEAPIAEPLPEQAEPEAEATSTEQFELLAAPRGAPDDLAKLTGVGPQIVKKLNEHGVFHYWQIAAMTPDEADKLDADLKFNGRIARDNWVDQARTLIAAA